MATNLSGFVPVSSGDGDWTKGLVGAAQKYADAVTTQDALAYERARQKKIDDRNEVLQAQQDAEYQRSLDMREFLKDPGVNLDAIRAEKSLGFEGVDGAAIAEHQGALRELIPVWREDAINNAATMYRKNFGESADPSLFASQFSHLPSYTEQQAREDKNTELRIAQNKTAADYDLKVAKMLEPSSSVATSFKSKGGGKIPTSLSDIDPVDMAKSFEGASFLGATFFRDSQQEDVTDLVNHLKTTMSGQGYSVPQIKAGVTEALTRLTEGSNLDHIDDNYDEAIKHAHTGAASYAAKPNEGYTRYSQEFKDYQDTVAKQLGGFKTFTPSDVKADRRTKAQKEINALLGIAPPTAASLPIPKTNTNKGKSTPESTKNKKSAVGETKPVPSVTLLTPEEEASIVADANIKGLRPESALDFARNQKRFENRLKADPNKVALSQPTTWTSIGTKKGTKNGSKENFQQFVKDINNVDISDPKQLSTIGKLYGTNAGPLPNEVVAKVISDVRSGDFLNQESDNQIAPEHVRNEPGLEDVYVLPAAKGGQLLFKGGQQLLKALKPAQAVINTAVKSRQASRDAFQKAKEARQVFEEASKTAKETTGVVAKRLAARKANKAKKELEKAKNDYRVARKQAAKDKRAADKARKKTASKEELKPPKGTKRDVETKVTRVEPSKVDYNDLARTSASSRRAAAGGTREPYVRPLDAARELGRYNAHQRKMQLLNPRAAPLRRLDLTRPAAPQPNWTDISKFLR